MTQAILRLPAVKAKVGLSRSSIYAAIAAGTFPAPVSIGRRAVGFIEAEVEKWILDRAKRPRSVHIQVARREPPK